MNTPHMKVDVKFDVTETDHKAAVCRVTRLGKGKGITCLLCQSSLSKRKTLASVPQTWDKYKYIAVLGFLEPNKTKKSFRNQDLIDQCIKNQKTELANGKLFSKSDLQRFMRLTCIKPYQKF